MKTEYLSEYKTLATDPSLMQPIYDVFLIAAVRQVNDQVCVEDHILMYLNAKPIRANSWTDK